MGAAGSGSGWRLAEALVVALEEKVEAVVELITHAIVVVVVGTARRVLVGGRGAPRGAGMFAANDS